MSSMNVDLKLLFIFCALGMIAILALISFTWYPDDPVPPPMVFTEVRKHTNFGEDSMNEVDTYIERNHILYTNHPATVPNNIKVAVFTSNTFWLSKKKLDQGISLAYQCPNTNRTLTVKSAFRNVTALRGADVVIFADGLDNIHLWKQVVSKRKEHQIWVYSTAESAFHSPQIRNNNDQGGIEDFHFNMSTGYNSMSNVVSPFGAFISFNSEVKFDLSDLKFNSKRKEMIAWVSSHCMPFFWNRTGFVQSLSQLLPVHTYGRCGDKSMQPGPVGTMNSYKFYLALENSCCADYITEKFWMALALYKSVPVVIGTVRSDYERVAPPNSFIYANDFDSMEELAAYLRKLAGNESLYYKFHEWRSRGKAENYGSEGVLPFTSQNSACALLNYIEKEAWKKNKQLSMRFDPFGPAPEWRGSCDVCGTQNWLRSYDLRGRVFHQRMKKNGTKR